MSKPDALAHLEALAHALNEAPTKPMVAFDNDGTPPTKPEPPPSPFEPVLEYALYSGILFLGEQDNLIRSMGQEQLKQFLSQSVAEELLQHVLEAFEDPYVFLRRATQRLLDTNDLPEAETDALGVLLEHLGTIFPNDKARLAAASLVRLLLNTPTFDEPSGLLTIAQQAQHDLQSELLRFHKDVVWPNGLIDDMLEGHLQTSLVVYQDPYTTFSRKPDAHDERNLGQYTGGLESSLVAEPDEDEGAEQILDGFLSQDKFADEFDEQPVASKPTFDSMPLEAPEEPVPEPEATPIVEAEKERATGEWLPVKKEEWEGDAEDLGDFDDFDDLEVEADDVEEDVLLPPSKTLAGTYLPEEDRKALEELRKQGSKEQDERAKKSRAKAKKKASAPSQEKKPEPARPRARRAGKKAPETTLPPGPPAPPAPAGQVAPRSPAAPAAPEAPAPFPQAAPSAPPMPPAPSSVGVPPQVEIPPLGGLSRGDAGGAPPMGATPPAPSMGSAGPSPFEQAGPVASRDESELPLGYAQPGMSYQEEPALIEEEEAPFEREGLPEFKADIPADASLSLDEFGPAHQAPSSELDGDTADTAETAVPVFRGGEGYQPPTIEDQREIDTQQSLPQFPVESPYMPSQPAPSMPPPARKGKMTISLGMEEARGISPAKTALNALGKGILYILMAPFVVIGLPFYGVYWLGKKAVQGMGWLYGKGREKLQEKADSKGIHIYEMALSEHAGKPGPIERVVAQSSTVMRGIQLTIGLHFVAIVGVIDSILEMITEYAHKVLKFWQSLKAKGKKFLRKRNRTLHQSMAEDLMKARIQLARCLSMPGYTPEKYLQEIENEELRQLLLEETFPVELVLTLRGHIDELKRDVAGLPPSTFSLKSLLKGSIGGSVDIEANIPFWSQLKGSIGQIIPNPFKFIQSWKDQIIMFLFMRYTRLDLETMYIKLVDQYQQMLRLSLVVAAIAEKDKDLEPETIHDELMRLFDFEEQLYHRTLLPKELLGPMGALQDLPEETLKELLKEAADTTKAQLQRLLQALSIPTRVVPIRKWKRADQMIANQEASMLQQSHPNVSLTVEEWLLKRANKQIKVHDINHVPSNIEKERRLSEAKWRLARRQALRSIERKQGPWS